MNEDELARRLRATLHERAATLRPTPGRIPSTPRLLPSPARRRRRWIPPAVGLVTAAAAAAVAAVLVGNHGGGKVGVGPTSHGSRPAVTAPVPTTAHSVPTTLAPVPVPSGFSASSVTFVSTEVGWAAGTYPCGSAACAAVAETVDGAATWSRVSAPQITFTTTTRGNLTAHGGSLEIRYVDARDGWIVSTPTDGPDSELWSTHDGGQSWNRIALPLPGTIEELEAAGGQAQLVELTNESYRIYSTPVGADRWAASSLQPAIGAGPVPASQLVLNDNSGWILDDDRTVVGGAILKPGSGWSAWTPPCSDATGTGVLAAATPTELYAVCVEGAWGSPAPGTTNGPWLFRSTDGGQTWATVGRLPSDGPGGTYDAATSLAVSPRGTLVEATGAGLEASFDGGHTWSTVFGGQMGYVGFTTDLQAVAVTGSGQVLMSHDGGHTWKAVTF